MSSWFRMPAWAGGRLCGDHKATDIEAAADLLGRWDQGEDPSVAEMKRAWVWSWDKADAFVKRMRAWALESGARVPPETTPVESPKSRAGKTGSESGANREKTGRQNSDGQRIVAPPSGENRERIGSESGASRGRVQRSRQTETQTDEQQIAPPADAAAPAAVAPGPARGGRTPKLPAEKSPKREPHPAHSRFGPLWDEARRTARMAAYPWPKGGAEAGRTWKAVAELLDAHVSRDPERIDGDLDQLRAAMDRFHRKPTPAFPSGHTVLGFCANATVYLDATATGPPLRAAPPGARPSDLDAIGPGLQRFLDRHQRPASTG